MTPFIQKVKAYCQELIQQSHCAKLPFHNWCHTANVVQNVIEIGSAEKIDRKELEFLIVAAYFHDTGHVAGSESHEEGSCSFAENFLKRNGYGQEGINTVLKIIRTTAMPQNPQTKLQRIICDADLAHLGKPSFTDENRRLRLEWASHCDMRFSDREWVNMNIHFLELHDFKTSYGRINYNDQKNKNIRLLKDGGINQ
ncbi:HD domain-containing protein [Flavimarina sp. Hel_I_48]|uniref:HD domain-containing protein n=1 Tax=Flavimarina sp. Hel_I_48 TaxID=1392488 RepID=UPI0004DF8C15|nr:HD domain-containing protein [Flavimarina sp. Hel_I_48]